MSFFGMPEITPVFARASGPLAACRSSSTGTRVPAAGGERLAVGHGQRPARQRCGRDPERTDRRRGDQCGQRIVAVDAGSGDGTARHRRARRLQCRLDLSNGGGRARVPQQGDAPGDRWARHARSRRGGRSAADRVGDGHATPGATTSVVVLRFANDAMASVGSEAATDTTPERHAGAAIAFESDEFPLAATESDSRSPQVRDRRGTRGQVRRRGVAVRRRTSGSSAGSC